MGDLIYRQAAIDALKRDEALVKAFGYHNAIDAIRELPSAQPEPLTNREQRIFLSAMDREKKVCEQVDDEWRDCREPYDDSLVKTCHEITRKVRGALWT